MADDGRHGRLIARPWRAVSGASQGVVVRPKKLAFRSREFGSGTPRRSAFKIARLLTATLLHPEVVLHVADARNPLNRALGTILLFSAAEGSIKRDSAVPYSHIDLPGIGTRIVSQIVASIFKDAVIGPRIVGRTSARIVTPTSIPLLAGATGVIYRPETDLCVSSFVPTALGPNSTRAELFLFVWRG